MLEPAAKQITITQSETDEVTYPRASKHFSQQVEFSKQPIGHASKVSVCHNNCCWHGGCRSRAGPTTCTTVVLSKCKCQLQVGRNTANAHR